jgi:hypothetical protein|tara:strand:+ start:620 stop:760 length:141 start_codon:yes stop_codon:yes gene_type:complete
MTLSKDELQRLIELIEACYPKMVDVEREHYKNLQSRLSTQLIKLTA